MIFSSVNKIPAFLLEKLYSLFQLLQERKTEFEIFAGMVKDKHLKRTVLALAQETNQYAMELSGQLETMQGSLNSSYEKDNIQPNTVLPGNAILLSAENDILKSCEISETRMIIAYRSILNEPFLHDNLRKLIRCQLNGLTYAFMQLKLLHASLYIIIS
ncbi:MAG: hypothetical protein NVSMB7_04650 [Chitinophagaceae bacterium]